MLECSGDAAVSLGLAVCTLNLRSAAKQKVRPGNPAVCQETSGGGGDVRVCLHSGALGPLFGSSEVHPAEGLRADRVGPVPFSFLAMCEGWLSFHVADFLL